METQTSGALMRAAETRISADEMARREQRARRSLARLDGVATLMDDAFEVPIVKWRVGLDPIIGMIPGGGDWASWFVSVYIFWEATRLGVPVKVLVAMAGNIGVDLLGGYVPVFGDAFDFAFKANRRNVDMLREYYGAPPEGELTESAPIRLDPKALAPREDNPVARYALFAVLASALLALASGPFVILYWIINGFGG